MKIGKFLSIVLVCLIPFTVVGCSCVGENGKSAYEIAVENGFEGTEEEWLASLSGKDGENGADGANGVNGTTPTISINAEGYWVINGVVTEHKATGENGEKGEPGSNGTTPTISINAEGYWVINGVVTEHKATGEKGEPGANGTNGTTPTISINAEGYWVINGVVTEHKATGEKGEPGANGANGTTPTISINAEGYWVINGVVTGHKATGEKGEPGANGANGTTPTISINADGYWVINGVVTEHKATGEKGEPGANGANGTTPTISINAEGYWVINGVVTEHKATGEKGEPGANGTTPTISINAEGYWVINGVVTEHKATGEDGKDLDETCNITYVDGESVLFTQQVVKGGIACADLLSVAKDGYIARWLDEDGKEFDFSKTITEDITLTLIYEPFGAAEIYSDEVLSLIKKPAKVQFKPSEKYYQNYRYFAMQASVEMTKNGRLWSCWIGGEDGCGAYLLATYSDDRGETWKDIQFVIDPHDDSLPMIMNTHIGCFWQDPKGRLWLFYQQSYGMWDGEGANFAIVCENPDAENPVWSEPQYISIGASLKKPIVTSKGEWLLPVSVWERWHIDAPLKNERTALDAVRGARVYASTDEGKTWLYRGGVNFVDSQFNEHSIVELTDGRIMMYSRCASAIKKSYSSDWGRSWTSEEQAFPHVGSLAMIRTLPSGNILLIKHGDSFTAATSTRSHLTAFVSKDGGATYEGGLLLDERTGVSYPDIAIAADGTVFVQYDYNRTTNAQILFARFTEADVLAGAFQSAGSGTKLIIKDTNGIKGHPASVPEGAAFSGSGTQADPYKISTAKEWNYLANSVNNGTTYQGKYFEQTVDIDFGGANIQPVGFYLQGGSHKRAFMGHYDGKNHKMTNFTQDAQELYSRGLFGYVTAGSVKNLVVENALLRGNTNTGAIVGFANGSASNKIEISGCKTANNVSVIAYVQVGGIVGRAVGYVSILNCENNASVSIPFSHAGAQIQLGGIAGYIENNITIRSCVNNGLVSLRHGVNSYVGGICSNGKNCVIDKCVNNGDIVIDTNASDLYVGGIAGWNTAVTVTNCNTTGNITADGLAVMQIGGVIGYFGKDDSVGNVIENCIAQGDITVTAFGQASEISVGGIIGRGSGKSTDTTSRVRYTVFTGKVSVTNGGSNTRVGSFMGYYVGTKTAFEYNYAAHGVVSVGGSKTATDYTLYCIVNEDIALSQVDYIRSKQ